MGKTKSYTWQAYQKWHRNDAEQSFIHVQPRAMQPLTMCRQPSFNNWHWSGCGCLINYLWWAMLSPPCSLVCFTCKNQILKAIYMQTTNNFSGESKNHLLNFGHHLRKLSCTQALSVKVCALTVHTVFIMESICEDIHLIKSGVCSSSQ